MNQGLHSRRLVGIDMLRGIAALGVLLYHHFERGVFGAQFQLMPPYKAVALLPISFGYTGVYLFFVISGFCIHLRWAKAKVRGDGDFSIDFQAFWKRRIIRLYPAYFAAMPSLPFLSVLLCIAFARAYFQLFEKPFLSTPAMSGHAS